MQAVNVGNHFLLTGPPTEVETEHLIGTFGGRPSDPQADQQTGNQGHIHLDPHALFALAQQMPTAQHTCDPPEKQFDVLVTSRKIRMVRPSRVFILQRTLLSPS
jgi:hypothetical protein